MISHADIRPGRLLPFTCTFLVMSLMIGCRVTVLPPSSDDTARDRNAILREENETLKRENEGLKVRVSQAEADLDPGSLEVSQATPRLISMAIEDSSLIEPLDKGTGTSQLVLRMSPSDDRGRFVQVVGALSVTVVGVSLEDDPVLLGQHTFTPGEVRDAWRGGVMGSGYVFRLPLSGALHEALPDSVDVVTLFEVAGVDRPGLRDERPVRVRRALD